MTMTGSGTSSDPYIIYTFSDLQSIGTSPYTLDKYYKLGNDIDASPTQNSTYNSGAGWNPISLNGGSIDGNNFTINNLYISRPSTNYVGFLCDSYNCTLKNIKFTNVNITGNANVGIVGWINGGTLTNISVTGNINCNNGGGGVIGYLYYADTCSYLSFTGNVTVSSNACGGIVGCSEGTSGGTIDSCSVTNATLKTNTYCGGIVGEGYKSITNCTVSNSSINPLTTPNTGFGGITGWLNNSAANISNCKVINTNINGGNSSGGILGYPYSNATISNCLYSSGTINGSSYGGGIVGGQAGVVTITISKCYSTGTLNFSGTDVGGIGGLIGGAISNCFSTMKITSAGESGGLIGYHYANPTATVSNSYYAGQMTVTGSNNGGLVGRINGSTATSSYWDKEVSGQTTSLIGTGLTTAQMKTQSSYANWDFTTTWKIGALNNGYPTLINPAFIPPALIISVPTAMNHLHAYSPTINPAVATIIQAVRANTHLYTYTPNIAISALIQAVRANTSLSFYEPSIQIRMIISAVTANLHLNAYAPEVTIYTPPTIIFAETASLHNYMNPPRVNIFDTIIDVENTAMMRLYMGTPIPPQTSAIINAPTAEMKLKMGIPAIYERRVNSRRPIIDPEILALIEAIIGRYWDY